MLMALLLLHARYTLLFLTILTAFKDSNKFSFPYGDCYFVEISLDYRIGVSFWFYLQLVYSFCFKIAGDYSKYVEIHAGFAQGTGVLLFD